MFRDRNEAAERLADCLSAYRGRNPLVLAVPRGGVPMGRTIADRLEGELDVVLVHKLGAPGNPEYAIGAVDEAGHVRITGAAPRLAISDDYIAAEVRSQQERLRARRRLYGRPAVQAAGRVVIVVDDGVATGATLLAALSGIRAQHPERLVAAVGVAPPETVRQLETVADEVICLDTPQEFFAVGQFFLDFSQVDDDRVIALLATRGPSDGQAAD